MGGWVGGLSSIQFFLDFWNFFNFAKLLKSERMNECSGMDGTTYRQESLW